MASTLNPSAPEIARSKRADRYILRVTIALSLVWAGWRLGIPAASSFTFDEMVHIQVSELSTWGEINQAIPVNAAPLSYYLLHLMGPTGKSEFFLRLPTVLFGLLTVIPLWLLASRATPEKERPLTPTLAVLFLLSSPSHIVHSSETISSNQAVFWLTLCAFSAHEWLLRGRWVAILGAVAASWLAFETSYLAGYGIVGILAGVLVSLCRPSTPVVSLLKGRRWFGPLIWLIVMVPAWLLAWRRFSPLLEQEPRWSYPEGAVFWEALGNAFIGTSLDHLLRWPLVTMEVLFFLLGVWALVERSRAPQKKSNEHTESESPGCDSGGGSGDEPRDFVLLGWIGVGLPLMLWAFARHDHWLDTRYFTPFLAPFALIQALGVGRSRLLDPRADPASWRHPGIFAILLLVCAGMLLRRAVETGVDLDIRPRYGPAMEKLEDAPPATAVLVDAPITQYCYEFYRRRDYPKAPQAEVFQPDSRLQAMRLLGASEVRFFPHWFYASEPPSSFITGVRLSKLGTLMPAGALRLYDAKPGFEEWPVTHPETGELWTRIEMGEDAGPFLLSGWNQAEMWGGEQDVRWSTPRSVTGFELPGAWVDQSLVLHMSVFPQKGRNSGVRKIEALINDQRAAVFELPELKFSEVTLPLKVSDKRVKLTLQSADELEIPDSETRSISFAVDWIAISPPQ